ncbi:GntR family transcriptional regulator [Herbiconiux sp. A18JL235]|uniref:GntR family transcriptional regulator n=1 Tax=Herbiconiux sp. A18JL235 TaxID=3152363 RepID=A0AB39BGW3_9MICO
MAGRGGGAAGGGGAAAGGGADARGGVGGGLGFVVEIDARSGVAPFEQLRVEIRDAIAEGTLSAGARLPTVRALASELGLAANTVARTYKELEADKLIETRGRSGSFVSFSDDPARRELEQAARGYAARAAALGISRADALSVVTAALDAPRD